MADMSGVLVIYEKFTLLSVSYSNPINERPRSIPVAQQTRLDAVSEALCLFHIPSFTKPLRNDAYIIIHTLKSSFTRRVLW